MIPKSHDSSPQAVVCVPVRSKFMSIVFWVLASQQGKLRTCTPLEENNHTYTNEFVGCQGRRCLIVLSACDWKMFGCSWGIVGREWLPKAKAKAMARTKSGQRRAKLSLRQTKTKQVTCSCWYSPLVSWGGIQICQLRLQSRLDFFHVARQYFRYSFFSFRNPILFSFQIFSVLFRSCTVMHVHFAFMKHSNNISILCENRLETIRGFRGFRDCLPFLC